MADISILILMLLGNGWITVCIGTAQCRRLAVNGVNRSDLAEFVAAVLYWSHQTLGKVAI